MLRSILFVTLRLKTLCPAVTQTYLIYFSFEQPGLADKGVVLIFRFQGLTACLTNNRFMQQNLEYSAGTM